MNCFLFVDFGSTNTKITLVDSDKEEIVATAKAYTTVETDVMTGYNNALSKINEQVQDYTVIKSLACSSAAGGLKIIAIGLVPELTSEAAKRAALGAGAKVINTYSHNLTISETQEIINSNADIILLAGGTNGGDKNCILHNAKMLKEHGVKVPVVVAGNKSAADEICEIFGDSVEYHIVENVMPKINKLNVENARETIRQIFMENIVKAKGMKNIQDKIDGLIMPTPAAVLKAAEILSKGTDDEEGLGDLLIVDIGGATTDVHSAADGDPSSSGVFLYGLEEPFMKRTVEGDLGMRYSIPSVVEVAGKRGLRRYLPNEKQYDVEAEVKKRNTETSFISQTEKDLDFDSAIAKICVDISMKRHVGTLRQVYNGSNGASFQQEGKDLTCTPYLIGTGGILVYNSRYKDILEAGLFREDEPFSLKPKKPKFLLDKKYILSAMGLLATVNPDMAIRILKKNLVE
ncbi:MAG: MutL protein [Treponema sp.]|nr:MAG: MutL protein [Treponema sp.]